MRQSLASQVIIDKSRLRTNRPQPKPQKDKLLRVDKVHRNNLFRLDVMLLLQPCSITQCFLVDFFICPLSSFEYEEDAMAVGAQGVVFKLIEVIETIFLLATDSKDVAFEEPADEAVVYF